jgi:peptide/nickel transport system permease protein
LWSKRLFTLLLFVFAVLFIAALPQLIDMLIFGSSHDAILGQSTGKISPSQAFASMFSKIANYIGGIPSGKSFTYQAYLYYNSNSHEQVTETRNFFTDTRSFMVFSAVNMVSTSLLALLSGTFLGLFLARSGILIRTLLEFMAIIPDFAAAISLQLLVVFIFQQTGWLVAEVNTTVFGTAYLLPFLTLCYLPFTYMMRMVALQGYKVLTEDYILTAKSKGLKKWTIYARHVLRNVLPVIKADLFRIASIMTGNLVVIEYLFNSPGITRFLIPSLDRNLELKTALVYQKPNLFNQYPVMVNSLWSLILIFFITYGSMRLAMFGLERGFAND